MKYEKALVSIIGISSVMVIGLGWTVMSMFVDVDKDALHRLHELSMDEMLEERNRDVDV